MEYILINREGDAKIIADYKTSFETYTLQKLVDAYNKEAAVVLLEYTGRLCTYQPLGRSLKSV